MKIKFYCFLLPKCVNSMYSACKEARRKKRRFARDREDYTALALEFEVHLSSRMRTARTFNCAPHPFILRNTELRGTV